MFTHQEIADIVLHYAQIFPLAIPDATEDKITYVIDGHEFYIEKHEGGACALHQDGEEFEDGIFSPTVADLIETLREFEAELAC